MPDPRTAQLRRLLNHAHDTAGDIGYAEDAAALYQDATDVAEQRIPGPLGVAVAGVLAMAAEHRRASGARGALGADLTMLALARRVLELQPATAGR